MRRILTSFILLLAFSLTGICGDKLTLSTVVIDAGHGGKDPGAVSKDGQSYEKTFVLEIANNLADRIRESFPDVNVIQTRSTDHFVSLNDRAEIANKAGADLFISIHINSAGGTTANGYSVHVLGQSHKEGTDLYKANLAMVQRENSVIMLDDDYNPATAGFNPADPESYIFMTMMQSAYLEQSIQFAEIISENLQGGPIRNTRGVSQDPFYVLWKTSMPSVLVELGFISNEQDLLVLKQEKSRKELAECLFKAFQSYKQEYDNSMQVSKPAEVQDSTIIIIPDLDRGSVQYGVQIATLSKELPEGDSRLLGYKPVVRKSPNGKMYRYVIAVCGSKEEAKEKMVEIKKKYPDCFLVKIEEDSVSRVN